MVKRKNYLFQLKNERFKKFVQETKIEELEELIENYLQQVKKIKTNQRKVNVKNDLPSTIPQVKKEVLAILGVEEVEKCKVIYGDQEVYDKLGLAGRYYPDSKLIVLGRVRGKKLFPVLAHEYTHHIQNIFYPEIFDEESDYYLFAEGHAYGVERAASRTAAPASLLFTLEETTHYLKDQYLRLCSSRKITPKLQWKNTKPFGSEIHVFAGTAFALLESREGPGIYKAMLHGEYDW